MCEQSRCHANLHRPHRPLCVASAVAIASVTSAATVSITVSAANAVANLPNALSATCDASHRSCISSK